MLFPVQLNFLMKKHVLIRRLKDEVLTQLQPKQRTAVMVTIDNPEVERVCKRLTELRQAAQKLVDSSSTNSTAGLLSGFSAETRATLFDMYKKTGEAKLSAVLQYLSDLLENNTKFLVFAHHLAVLDGIEQFLIKNHVQHFRLDGSTSPADRQAGVDRFQTDSRCRVALLSITAGGTGITLTASSTVVFAELQFTPALLLQAEDRVHRIGQPNAVNIHYLLGRHSLDDLLWPLLVKKLQVLGTTLNGEEDEMEFESVRGEAASGQEFKKGNAMEQWLQREDKRKAEQAKKEAALEARRAEKWKDAIQVDSDDEQPLTPLPPSSSRPPTPQAGEGDEEDVEPRDSMWVYLSGDDEDGFVVNDDEQEEEDADEGEAEMKGGDEEEEKEEEEDDEDEFDRKYDSDSSFAPDDGETAAGRGREEEDEDDGEAEWGEEQQPVRKKRPRRRVLRSDDDDAEEVEEVEEVKEERVQRRRRPTGRRTPTSPFPLSSLTPPSSTSSSSSSSAEAARGGSPWASVFGLNLQTVEEESARQKRKLNAAQRAAQQREAEKAKTQRNKREEKEEVMEEEEVDEDAAITASPAASGGDGGGSSSSSSGLMSEADLCVMLVGMDFSAATVRRVLRGMASEAKKGEGGEALIDINMAIERLTAEPAQSEEAAEEKATEEAPPSRRTRARGKAEDDAVPCERCDLLIPFFDYNQHLRACRRSAIKEDQEQRGEEEEKVSEETERASGGGGEEEEEEEVEEVPMKSRPSGRRSSRLIDLEDAEEVEDQIVTNEDSVDSVSGVEWVND